MEYKNIPHYIRYLVQTAREIKTQLGYISEPVLMRRFGITFAKAEEVMKYVKENNW